MTTTHKVLIGVAIAVAGGIGFVGYKKGWFGNKEKPKEKPKGSPTKEVSDATKNLTSGGKVGGVKAKDFFDKDELAMIEKQMAVKGRG